MLVRLLILLIFLLGLVPTVDAATITAASCSKADVRAAIKATANSGDTVLIPPGTCHWTGSGSDGGLGIYCDAASLGYDNTFCKNGSTTRGDTKQLTIKGAGIGQTIIYDDIAKNSDPPALINWQTKPGGLSRISGIEFRGGTYNGSPCPGDNLGSVMISGNTDQFRMDNNKFVPMSGCTAFVMGTASGNSYLRGVIDHNTIDCSAVSVCTNYFNGASWQNVGCCGDNSWAQPDTVGTSEALFLEDNVWINNQTVTKSGSFCMDGWAGFRVVMRYNSIRACSIGGHGTDSAGGTARGLRQLEFYNNTWTGPDGVSPWNMGGAALTSVMSARSGVAVVFNNTISVTNGNVLFAFDGSNFRDFQAFPPWGQCNGSSPYDQNVSSGGYRCIDQVGAGYGQLMQTGGTAPINTATGTAKWPNQIAQPGYVWNNTVNGVPVGANGTTSHVVVGRDLINGPRPFMADGVTPYKPYTYPHPLVSGSGDSAPPAAPTGLKVS